METAGVAEPRRNIHDLPVTVGPMKRSFPPAIVLCPLANPRASHSLLPAAAVAVNRASSVYSRPWTGVKASVALPPVSPLMAPLAENCGDATQVWVPGRVSGATLFKPPLPLKLSAKMTFAASGAAESRRRATVRRIMGWRAGVLGSCLVSGILQDEGNRSYKSYRTYETYSSLFRSRCSSRARVIRSRRPPFCRKFFSRLRICRSSR